MSHRLLRVFVCSFALAAATSAAAQPPAPAVTPVVGDRLRVYLDCFDCFSSFLRDEIKWVDFVRQPQDADVHLLSSSRETGGGGREVTLRFVGVNDFAGVNHDLRVVTLTGETENIRRQAVLRTVVIGLLDYLAHRGLPEDIDVKVTSIVRADAPATTPAADPWDLWVFAIRAGTSLDEDANTRELEWDARVSGDRVTEDWKISFGARTDTERETFNRLDEEDEEPFTVTRRDREIDWFVARSLGPHWSVGFDGDVQSSTFGNTRFSGGAAPAVEFSVFPYRDYATRQLLFQYQVGVEHVRYNEITIFDQLRETLWTHEVSGSFDQRQPWGSLDARLEWSQYLHDFSKYRLEADGDLSVRLFRGLSVYVEGSASRIRDQLSLPRRDATAEEVLLRLRELQSDYQFRFRTGFTYSFGSIFNNVVNPRFGG